MGPLNSFSLDLRRIGVFLIPDRSSASPFQFQGLIFGYKKLLRDGTLKSPYISDQIKYSRLPLHLTAGLAGGILDHDGFQH